MAIVYNQVGALTMLQEEMKRNQIPRKDSLHELNEIFKNHAHKKQDILDHYRKELINEKNGLDIELPLLKGKLETKKNNETSALQETITTLKAKVEALEMRNGNFILRIFSIIKRQILLYRANRLELNFDRIVQKKIEALQDEIESKTTRYSFLNDSPEKALTQSSIGDIALLNEKKEFLSKNQSLLFGAIGEMKVLATLKRLPNSCYIINDFRHTFEKALYRKDDQDYIKSIQIDHLVITPAGIFLLETKNWSNHTLYNNAMLSPMEQIERANYALYRLINPKKLSSALFGNNKKLTIRSILVMLNKNPIGNYPYLKILSPDNLLGYINYFPEVYTKQETEELVNKLFELNEGENVRVEG